MIPDPLTLGNTLGLIKDYDGHINTLWNIYLVAVGATLTVLKTESWKPHPRLLASVFFVFALGNLYALQKFFRVKDALLQYARGLAEQDPARDALKTIFSSMQPSSVGGLIVFHLVFDVAVIAIIFIFAHGAAKGGLSRARKTQE